MTIESIKKWFEIAMPEPTDKNRAVQIGCHLEEVAEMLDPLGDYSYNHFAEAEISELAEQYKKFHVGVGREEVNPAVLLDSLADQIVTAIGVAHMFGLDIVGALTEVDRSNYSKFVDGLPVFDKNGKIAKPPTYSPPDLSKFI